MPQGEDPRIQQILAKSNEMLSNGIAPQQIDQWVQGELRAQGLAPAGTQWYDSAQGAPSASQFGDVQSGASSTDSVRAPLAAAASQTDGVPTFGILGAGAPADALTGPTAAQEAYRKTMAEEQAKLAAYDAMTRKVADRTTATTMAEAQAKTRADALGSLGSTQASFSRLRDTITKAMNHPGLSTVTGLSGRLDPRNALPGTDAADARALIQ